VCLTEIEHRQRITISLSLSLYVSVCLCLSFLLSHYFLFSVFLSLCFSSGLVRSLSLSLFFFLLFLHLFLSVCMSVCMSISLPLFSCLYVCLSVSQCLFFPLCLYVCLSRCLSVNYSFSFSVIVWHRGKLIQPATTGQLVRPYPGNPFWRRRINTVDLHALTTFDQGLLLMKIHFFLSKARYLTEEVNGIELFPSVRVPCPIHFTTVNYTIE
jgi:hypothetical protein